MKNEIEKLKKLTNVYSEVHSALNEIQNEVTRLATMRHELSEVLKNTRCEEKKIINKLEKTYNKKLKSDDILEIIKTYEQGLIL
jgi:hypothetical protein